MTNAELEAAAARFAATIASAAAEELASLFRTGYQYDGQKMLQRLLHDAFTSGAQLELLLSAADPEPTP